MSDIADEIKSYYGIALRKDYKSELCHYGVKFRSGRYPYGSGEDPYQHVRDFRGRIEQCRKEKFTYTDENGKTWTGDNAIAKSMGLTSTEFRFQVAWAKYEDRLLKIETVKALQKDGLNNSEIAKKMGLKNESSVRSLLNPSSEKRMEDTMGVVSLLKENVDKKGMIDVGTQVEKELNISKERLNMALDYLEKVEGCPVYEGGIPQINAKGQQTIQKVLCPPGTEYKEIYNYDKIHTINEYRSDDNGQTFRTFQYPASISSKRVKILLKDEVGPDGEVGEAKDGIIQIRPGVPDLSLGNDHYAQVRILVDGDKYLKGMAVYSNNLPDGVDVLFNSNKKTVEDGYKKIKEDDPENPFGSLIGPEGQSYYTGKDGKQHLSAINKRASEGDWSEWSDALPAQFLSKQNKSLAKKQLDLARADKLDEFDTIMALENPTVKKHLLEKFADGCDSAAVHLKAAALPGQKYHVIIPVNNMKDTEIYAPRYENGTKLALVRYPHGGIFEIPVLTVNNKNQTAKNLLGTTMSDAVCITKKIADQLSGADFDGDTVMCIPTDDANGKVKIKRSKPLKELEGFDTKSYRFDEMTTEVKADGTKVEHYYRNGQEIKIMKDTGKQMGVISNLITDMTLGGATDSELARAVKHSMVVIDAEKHKLDYKASEIENDIKSLQRIYQKKTDANGNPTGEYGGAATLISRSKGEVSIDKRQGQYKVNMKGTDYYDPTKPEGAKIWKTSDKYYYADVKRNYDKRTVSFTTKDGKKITYDMDDADAVEKYKPIKIKDEKTGEIRFTNRDGDIEFNVDNRKQQSKRMAETDDAYSLLSANKYEMEVLYADYANDMKSLANQARLARVNAGKIAINSTAKEKYADEVKSLKEKLDKALLNSTKERQATRMANAELKAAKDAAKEKGKKLDGETERKIGQRAIEKARNELGAIKRRERNIDITDKEWEAIQAGAVSEKTLTDILNNTDIDKLRQLATPKTVTTMRPAQVSLIQTMAKSNYTLSQIAQKLGVSTSTVSDVLRGKKGA